MTPDGHDADHEDAPIDTQESSLRTASGGYQSDSPEPASAPRVEGSEAAATEADSTSDQTDSRQPDEGFDSDVGSPGHQIDSEQPPSSAEVPGSVSPVDDDEERIDPFQAFAEVSAKVRTEKERRDPGIWLPGENELDQEPGLLPDSETRFSRDAYGGRGNPQVSVRLRPSDFERLRRAADLYGVRPTTLARMMVIRGIRAILDAELHRKGEFLQDRGRF